MDLEPNPEEKELWWIIRKSLTKRPQWKLSEHWWSDTGTSI
jgi:hypothetical protein